MKTLKDVNVGERATVVKLHGEGPVRRRIMDMGTGLTMEIWARRVHRVRGRGLRGGGLGFKIRE